MDLLDELNNFDQKGSKRLRIKGNTEDYLTYRIPIDRLKYNRLNDRIGSFITEYTDENDISNITEDILEDFLYKSSDQNKRTMNNVKAIGQLEPAVVMSDGTVVDGNRRFTCLRKLYRETHNDKFKYIIAVILDKSKYTSKDIKKFELQIQNVEEKVKYNPIDRYVGIYRDLIRENHEFSIEEYAMDSNKKESEIKEEILLTNLMIQYLEFINKPLKFHYARNNNLDGTIQEMKSTERSNSIDTKDKHIIKEMCFSSFASGLDSKKIRTFLETTKNSEVFDEERKQNTKTINDEVYNSLHEKGYVEDGLKNKTKDFVNTLIEDNGLAKEKNKDEKLLDHALNNLKKIDVENVSHMDESHKDSFSKKLSLIHAEIDKLESINNVKE